MSKNDMLAFSSTAMSPEITVTVSDGVCLTSCRCQPHQDELAKRHSHHACVAACRKEPILKGDTQAMVQPLNAELTQVLTELLPAYNDEITLTEILADTVVRKQKTVQQSIDKFCHVRIKRNNLEQLLKVIVANACPTKTEQTKLGKQRQNFFANTRLLLASTSPTDKTEEQ